MAVRVRGGARREDGLVVETREAWRRVLACEDVLVLLLEPWCPESEAAMATLEAARVAARVVVVGDDEAREDWLLDDSPVPIQSRKVPALVRLGHAGHTVRLYDGPLNGTPADADAVASWARQDL